MKQPIDFHAVPHEHRHIDRRLLNWARWVRDRPQGFVHPMWRAYKSSEVWASEPGIPVDSLDAADLERSVSALPERHRDALRWSYVYRGRPWKMCRALGVSEDGLAGLIRDGRQMLINRDA
jgi:hypothetical protein